MAGVAFMDVVPDPGGPNGLGIAALVILFVIGFVIFIAAGLVVFLWYRKRSRRHLETEPRGDRLP